MCDMAQCHACGFEFVAVLELAKVLVALDAGANDDGRPVGKILPREID